jgi:cytoskeleton protein RodZ
LPTGPAEVAESAPDPQPDIESDTGTGPGAGEGEQPEADAPAEIAEPADDASAAPDAETEAPADDGAYTPTPGAPQVSVTLTFSGDCWTEVTDSSGRRLFYALGQDGRVVNLSGDAPMRLILGDADFVSVSVEGRPWPIPASARRGQLARLTIPAQ